MEEKKITAQEIQDSISGIEKDGIGVDRARLLKDMCTQFTEYWEWFREYVVNACDAMAAICTVTIEEFEDDIIITVEDDGHGMPKDIVLVFMTLFKSVKFGERKKTVGCHGAGKLSVFASENLTKFAMTTSTGKECWQMNTGSLLDDGPVTINGIAPVPPQGTKFKISFNKKAGHSYIVNKARNILRTYCQYLPMDIVLKTRTMEQPRHEENYIRGSWNLGPERLAQVYQAKDDRGEYEIIIGLNAGIHSIYQNRVLISTRYNLLKIIGRDTPNLPLLDIRVDSPDFKPNFGRNKLTNEYFLHHISSKIKNVLIPKYFNQLADMYMTNTLKEIDIDYSQIETLASSILKHSKTWISSAATLPIFRIKNGMAMSYQQLLNSVAKNNRLYLEDSDSTGVDFSVFDAPVLSLSQPTGGLDLLRNNFSSALVNLGMNNTVLEAPVGSSKDLGPVELAFEKNLGFHPDMLDHRYSPPSDHVKNSKATRVSFELMEKGFLDTVCEESKDAQTDLESLSWKVNYLVDRDGKTPNTTHRFLLKDHRIILNLHHPEIQNLLELSKQAGNLAGHWAMAMCLCENNNLLSHLTPEAREDLLIIDAMSRCGKKTAVEKQEKTKESYEENTAFDFERNNLDLWL